MLKWFISADKGVDLLVRWVGLYAIVSGLLSWLWKNAAWFGELTWPQAILAGMGLALCGLLLLAITLAIGAWGFRLFKPLPPKPDIIDSRASEQNYATHSDIHRLDEQFLDVREKLTFIRGIAEGAGEMAAKLRSETEAHRSLDGDYYRMQIASLYASLQAVYHRERLLEVAQKIDRESLELGIPIAEGQTMDKAEWEQWKEQVNHWEADVGKWASYAAIYLGRDPMPEIKRISVEGLNEDWGAKPEQFVADPEGLRVYKTFRIYVRNWANIRDVVHDKVRRKAFEGVDV